MSPVWKQYKEYVVIVMALCFAFVMVRYGIVPLHGSIRERMDGIQGLLTDREIREGLVAKLPELRGQMSSVEENEDRLRVVIPKSRIVSLVETIENLAKETDNAIKIETDDQSGGSVSRVKQDSKNEDASKGDNHKEKTLRESLPSDHSIEITVTLTGKYNDILRFLQKIETMSYVTDILSVSLGVRRNDASGRVGTGIFTPNPALQGDATVAASAEVLPQEAPALPLEAKLRMAVYIIED